MTHDAYMLRIERELWRVMPPHYVVPALRNIAESVANGTMLLTHYDGASFISIVESDMSMVVMLFPESFDRRMLANMRDFIRDHSEFDLSCCTQDPRMGRILERLGFDFAGRSDEGDMFVRGAENVRKLYQ
jgi:hypothetical protein